MDGHAVEHQHHARPVCEGDDRRYQQRPRVGKSLPRRKIRCRLDSDPTSHIDDVRVFFSTSWGKHMFFPLESPPRFWGKNYLEIEWDVFFLRLKLGQALPCQRQPRHHQRQFAGTLKIFPARVSRNTCKASCPCQDAHAPKRKINYTPTGGFSKHRRCARV